MKVLKDCLPIANARRSRRLSLWGFVRVAALLTLGASISMLLIMLVSGDPQLWRMSGASVWVRSPRSGLSRSQLG